MPREPLHDRRVKFDAVAAKRAAAARLLDGDDDDDEMPDSEFFGGGGGGKRKASGEEDELYQEAKVGRAFPETFEARKPGVIKSHSTRVYFSAYPPYVYGLLDI